METNGAAWYGRPGEEQECRGSRRGNLRAELTEDLRFALRMLRKSPGFAAAAVLTLALGIGANTAIFSAVNAILLQPLPYAEPSRLVTIAGYKHFSTPGVVGYIALSPYDWKDIQTKSPAIEQLGTYEVAELTLTGEAEPEKLSGAKVSADFFSLFGVRPLLGRVILPSDVESHRAEVAVLSFGLWRSTFTSDPAILGRRILLNQKPYAVIGVMPSGFDFGAGDRGLWVPQTDQSSASAVARLRRRSTITQTNAQLKVAATWFAAKNPTLFSGSELVASQLARDTGDAGDGLLILLGAVGFVLLIACVNVSSLLLARGYTRLKEVAIRKALGATRLRIARQFLVENLVLSVCGGMLGLVFASLGIRTLRAIAPPGTPNASQLRVDLVVLGFTAGISLLTGVLFGLAPALQVSGDRAGASLNEKSGRPSLGISSQRPSRLRAIFVIVEVALAVILVVGATLASRSFENMVKLKLGFHTSHILSLSADFSTTVCDPQDEKKIAQCGLAVEGVLDRIRALPGVEAAAVTSYIPLGGADGALSLRIYGQSVEVGIEHGTQTFVRPISADYFQSMGIPILAGRAFDNADARSSQRVAIVNETFARAYFSGNALGNRISPGNDRNGKPEWVEIVGEVRDSHDVNLLQKPSAEYYVPFMQAPLFPGGNFLVRTTEDPLAIAAAIRQEIWHVDKNAPITNLKTMDQVVAEQVAEPRFRSLLLGAFGVLGLVLATVGIYGVVSYAVSQRTHEIGVRMALGAHPRDVSQMVIKEGMLVAGIGIAVGIGGALALTRFLSSLLFEIKPTDPSSFIGVAILLTSVALLACYIPARRAMRVDPMVALRYE